MSELVLVTENSYLEPLIQGRSGRLITDGREQVFGIIRNHHTFLPRDKAEHDFQYRQIIPYVMVCYHGEYLLLQRTNRQTETRLHNRYSLGIGGHINPVPEGNDKDIVMEGLRRELREEVSLEAPGDPRFVGIISDESNSVSRVHFGLFYELDVRRPGFRILEADKMTGRWCSLEELKRCYAGLETWSRIICDDYIL